MKSNNIYNQEKFSTSKKDFENDQIQEISDSDNISV